MGAVRRGETGVVGFVLRGPGGPPVNIITLSETWAGRPILQYRMTPMGGTPMPRGTRPSHRIESDTGLPPDGSSWHGRPARGFDVPWAPRPWTMRLMYKGMAGRPGHGTPMQRASTRWRPLRRHTLAADVPTSSKRCRWPENWVSSMRTPVTMPSRPKRRSPMTYAAITVSAAFESSRIESRVPIARSWRKSSGEFSSVARNSGSLRYCSPRGKLNATCV